MLNNKTTPRPWCAIETPTWALGIGNGNKVIANIPAGSDTGAADRALIVRAVNAHEQSIAALERAYLRMLQMPMDGFRIAPETQGALAALRDAIALARGLEDEDVQNAFEAATLAKAEAQP